MAGWITRQLQHPWRTALVIDLRGGSQLNAGAERVAARLRFFANIHLSDTQPSDVEPSGERVLPHVVRIGRAGAMYERDIRQIARRLWAILICAHYLRMLFSRLPKDLVLAVC